MAAWEAPERNYSLVKGRISVRLNGHSFMSGIIWRRAAELHTKDKDPACPDYLRYQHAQDISGHRAMLLATDSHTEQGQMKP